MNIQPFYVIPILIKQPTWGGDYIVKAKQLSFSAINNLPIGQSYELSAESRISPEPSAQDACYLTDSSMSSGQQFGSVMATIDLQSLISSNPEEVLGINSQNDTVSTPLLIKFTQAQSNSYQVHVIPGQEFHGWQAKPESWYFLQEGRATLGVKPGAMLTQYKKICLEIEAFSKEISQQIKDESLLLEEGKEKLSAFIEARHPNQYVHQVKIAQNAVIDLSQGGIHHSWEKDPSLPNGNIVYEVQLDVKDERSTMRSFDQGNIKPNGDVRPLHIEDYFQALNPSPEANQPFSLIKQPQGNTQEGVRIAQLFDTAYYTLKRFEFFGPSSQVMKMNSFHHVFALQGELRIEWRDLQFDLKEGRSLFVPAICEQYLLSSTEPATALVTSLPLN